MALPNELNFTVGFPTDEGFFGRECNNPTCRRYFKVQEDSIKPQMHCPYCGQDFPNDQLWTPDQLRYVKGEIAHEVMPMIEKELSDMLRRTFSGSKHIKYVPGTPGHYPRPQPPTERKVDSELACPDCHTRFQVDGIFGYCPGCRSENLRLYDANLTIIKREVDSSTNPERALRHAYADLVSTFETFCRKEANRLSIDRGRFQNLDHTRRLFRRSAGIDIFTALDVDGIRLLKRVFEKRHVHEHNEGVISQRYVDQIPEDAALLGQKAELTVQELEEAASILRRVLEQLVKAR